MSWLLDPRLLRNESAEKVHVELDALHDHAWCEQSSRVVPAADFPPRAGPLLLVQRSLGVRLFDLRKHGDAIRSNSNTYEGCWCDSNVHTYVFRKRLPLFLRQPFDSPQPVLSAVYVLLRRADPDEYVLLLGSDKCLLLEAQALLHVSVFTRSERAPGVMLHVRAQVPTDIPLARNVRRRISHSAQQHA